VYYFLNDNVVVTSRWYWPHKPRILHSFISEFTARRKTCRKPNQHSYQSGK